MKSILAWVGGLRRGEVEPEAYQQALTQLRQHWHQQEQKLDQLEVAAPDRELWQNLVRPGLRAAYRCLIAAANEGLLYGNKRDPQYLPALYHLLDSFARIHAVLQAHLKDLTGWAQEHIARELAAQIQPYQPPDSSTGQTFRTPDHKA